MQQSSIQHACAAALQLCNERVLVLASGATAGSINMALFECSGNQGCDCPSGFAGCDCPVFGLQGCDCPIELELLYGCDCPFLYGCDCPLLHCIISPWVRLPICTVVFASVGDFWFNQVVGVVETSVVVMVLVVASAQHAHRLLLVANCSVGQACSCVVLSNVDSFTAWQAPCKSCIQLTAYAYS